MDISRDGITVDISRVLGTLEMFLGIVTENSEKSDIMRDF